jgi:hypothetical protein
MKTPIYEQIHIDGQPSGLYRHAGDAVAGRFIKNRRHAALRTMASILAQPRPPARRPATPPAARPPQPGPGAAEIAAMVRYFTALPSPCPRCGEAPCTCAPPPPNTLDEVLRVQRAPGQRSMCLP